MVYSRSISMIWFQAASQAANGLAKSSLAQWAGAIATFLAVLVALFKDSALGWLRKPCLEAKCTKESPWTIRTKMLVYDRNTGKVLWNGECYYVRVEVTNSGRTRAKKVQVYALKLEKVALDGKAERREEFIPLNLKWANSPPSGPTVVLDGISPDMGAFCDLISVCDPANTYQDRPDNTQKDVTIAQLQLEVDPTNRAHLLSPGKYRLTLRIAAANAKPIEKILEFEHKGEWLENDKAMRQDCLAVSLS